jgi:predicted Zn-dependent peptidase
MHIRTLVCGLALAQTAQAATPLKLDVEKTTLPNGLRVVMSVDHTSPTVAIHVVYDVGGRNEERGRSGFAHLFEHMMFQGSANVPRGEHFKLVTAHGGVLNGNTTSDRTAYFEVMPRSELPLVLWLEGDRMKSLDVSQKNFENQRAVVQEEYRMRVENAAYVPAQIRLDELVFQGYWPYAHSAIGTMRDLDAAQLEWVRRFHESYYAPNDAVLAISGDFDVGVAKELAMRFFGNVSPQPNIPKYEPPPMPERKAPREAVMEDAHAKHPALLLGWAIPPARDPDHYALELAAMLLADGESSRLHRWLVRERGVATEVTAETGDHRGPDSFEIEVKLAGNAKIAVAEKMIDEELASLAKSPPTEAEMTKLRNRFSAHFLLGLESNRARAQALAEFELYWGDAALLNSELDRYLAVTAKDIQRVVARYLVREQRSRVDVMPGSAPRAPAGGVP